MPLSASGSGLACVDAGNGRVTAQWVNGNPVFDDSMSEVVLSLLVELPGWFADHQKKRQSKLSTVKTVDSSTQGKIEQYARDALQPAIDDRRLRSVAPAAMPNGLGFILTVAYVTGTGKASSVSVPLST
jgi:phage gp46-like protein